LRAAKGDAADILLERRTDFRTGSTLIFNIREISSGVTSETGCTWTIPALLIITSKPPMFALGIIHQLADIITVGDVRYKGSRLAPHSPDFRRNAIELILTQIHH